MTTASLHRINDFYQEAVSNRNSVFQSNDVLSLLVSKIPLDGVDNFVVKLMKKKSDNSMVCLTMKTCEDKNALMEYFKYIEDAIF